MKTSLFRITLWSLAAAFFVIATVNAQKEPPKIGTASKPVIFVVLNDGKWIEPIGLVDDDELKVVSDDEAEAKVFGNRYYKPKVSYPLIFGGALDGSVTVVKSNIGTECGGASADVTLKAAKAKPLGLVMALASDLKLKPDTTSYRRRPTPAEKAAVEKLVRAEFTKNGATAAALKALRFFNLTALDFESDDMADFVGSYWIAPTAKERRLLFFIAEQKGSDGIKIVHSEHSIVTPDDMMSGDLKDLEGGRGAELLVDVLDYDGDGVREIFTIGQAFEGNNYYAYKRTNGKWTKVFETYNYRCAF
ncbi:MAG TPA: hypothetical protein VJV05_11100 [Pyrinomonadaceae bacterium]|nr:hypothetical protein [Pyrinomonadaceae bacterium]